VTLSPSRISQKSARGSIYFVKRPRGWLLKKITNVALCKKGGLSSVCAYDTHTHTHTYTHTHTHTHTHIRAGLHLAKKEGLAVLGWCEPRLGLMDYWLSNSIVVRRGNGMWVVIFHKLIRVGVVWTSAGPGGVLAVCFYCRAAREWHVSESWTHIYLMCHELIHMMSHELIHGSRKLTICMRRMSDSLVVRRGNGMCLSHQLIHIMCHGLMHTFGCLILLSCSAGMARVWGMSHVYVRHVKRINAIMSHIWMRLVTHIKASCCTYECVMSHIWMRHVTHTSGVVTPWRWRAGAPHPWRTNSRCSKRGTCSRTCTLIS